MRRYLCLEFKRAFCNINFILAIAIAFGICIWHFIENVWKYRNYILDGTYPLSAFEKWIGADMSSLQPLLYFLLIPILCALPYARSFYFDVKSGFIIQLITRENKEKYIAAKFIIAFLNGAVIAVIPLIGDFIMTNTVFPAIIPQSGTGFFSICDTRIWAELFYTHPYVYLMLYGLMDAVFFGLFNTIAIWAVTFINNGFWITLMPFLSYAFIYCMFTFVDMLQYAPVFFLQPNQTFKTAIEAELFELLILVLLNVFFYLWYAKRERINYE
ncbi:MAG: hypothetical protein II073_08170 [Lachnospiraceae bacterium]|nr:hypothetical protein [Lachnospiraceae bacterium]